MLALDIGQNSMEVHQSRAEKWRITLVDTGADTMTGGRIRRIKPHIGDETFCMTYGDGVGDVNVRALIAFHNASQRDATVYRRTPTRPLRRA